MWSFILLFCIFLSFKQVISNWKNMYKYFIWSLQTRAYTYSILFCCVLFNRLLAIEKY